MSTYGVIYGLYDPRTDELRYVGQTTQLLSRRLTAHLIPTALHRRTHLAHWLSDLKSDGFQPRIEVLESVSNADALNSAEINTIQQKRDDGMNLTNCARGGLGAPRTQTAATREKISRAHKGRKHSPEHIAKVAAKRRGCRHTEETKQRISAKKKGFVLSPESRAKLSASLTGRTLTPEHKKNLAAAAERRRTQRKQEHVPHG